MSKVIHIWRMTNRDDQFEDASYYSTKELRDYVVNDCYDNWEEGNEDEDTPTKEQLMQDDNILLDYLDTWGFNLECIASIRQEDFN